MNAPAPEFTRVLDIRHLPPGEQVFAADAEECRRLAGRFAITAIDRFIARVTLTLEGSVVTARGRIEAALIQPCAISGEDFAVAVDEPLALRFVPANGPATHAPDEEIELSAADCDEIDYTGLTFDLGEALAQTLALAIDPFAEGPEADRARIEHNLSGDGTSGPFAALSALKPKA